MIRFLYFSLLAALLATATSSQAQDSASAEDITRDILTAQKITPAEPELVEPEAMIGELILVEDTADQVLKLLEQMTDKVILRRQDLPVSKFTFNSRGPLTKREAVLALESLLTLNGVMLTDMGGRFMKAVPATNVNTHVPKLLAGSTLDLDPSQQIYAKLFKLDYLNTEQADATLIRPLLSQNSSIVPFTKSNALLITDALINLQRIESILAETDKAQSVREELKFIKLEFIQAAEMQERIEKLIQGPLKSYLEGNTSVTADERTNQLILITHSGNVSMIMDVISSLDVDAAPLTSSEVFQLRQAKAEEVVPIIEDIISGQKEGREEDAKVARDNEQNNNRGNQGDNNPAPTVVVNAPVIAGLTEANSSLQFSNFVGLAADERTNSIVAYGTQQDLKTLKELIEKIDIPLPQVLIEAIITEVSLNDNRQFGLSAFGFSYDENGAGTGTGASIAEYAANLVLPGLGIEGTSNPFTLETVIEEAESDSDIRILSTPRVVVSHNEEAVIKFGESRPFVTSTTNSIDASSLERSQVEYRDVGIQLTVTPLIGADGTVQMTVEQTVDNVQPGGTFDRPIIGNREASSTVSVLSGELIILGGLQENQYEERNSYFPLIGRLPLVRSILGTNTDDWARRELIIFLRPTVLNNPTKAAQVSEATVNNISESAAVKKFLETGSTGDTYLEGSKFEEDEPQPKTENTKPRSLRR